MWIQLFTITMVLAVALAFGAIFVDSDEKPGRRYARKRYTRVRARG
jgi:hypothetical protein